MPPRMNRFWGDESLREAVLPAPSTQIDFVSIDVEPSCWCCGFDLERHQPRILLIEANDAGQRQAIDDHLAS
jgi:hypothetical protein